MMGIILVMSTILPFIYFTLAIKWWIVATVTLFAFSLATPNYLVDKNWDKDFLYAPLVTLWGLFNILRVATMESSNRLGSFFKLLKRINPFRKDF